MLGLQEYSENRDIAAEIKRHCRTALWVTTSVISPQQQRLQFLKPTDNVCSSELFRHVILMNKCSVIFAHSEGSKLTVSAAT